MSAESIASISDEVSHLRSLTIDLLRSAPASFLEFSPHNTMSASWKIFRHIARVEENYAAAIHCGTMVFGFDDSAYAGGNKRRNLLDYLQSTAEKLSLAVTACSHLESIDWFGEPCSLPMHLTRLATHESLHHGQLILYARSAGISLPPSWADWGE